MPKRQGKHRSLGRLIVLSVLGHMGLLFLLGRSGTFEFTPPVAAGKSIEVALQQGDRGGGKERRDKHARRRPPSVPEQGEKLPGTAEAAASVKVADASPPPDAKAKAPEPPPAPVAGSASSAAAAEEGRPPAEVTSAREEPAAKVTAPAAKAGRKLKLPPPLRSSAEFVSAISERLTYKVTLRGFPIGEAELAAGADSGKMKITARLRSSPLAETFYRVDDRVESELVAGNYLVTTISQHEGDYYRNSGFTIMMREKKAFSTDRLQGRFVTDTLPSSEVIDPITGLYFLRNQPLHQGDSLLLHLYDSGGYQPASVEVLRQERIRVPGLGEVQTLVIRPHLLSSGLFRRVDRLLIWLTDDRFRVPVRMKARIALGEVTAEIVSSEVER